jgi:C-terminal processing protease CtpA/Prc
MFRWMMPLAVMVIASATSLAQQPAADPSKDVEALAKQLEKAVQQKTDALEKAVEAKTKAIEALTQKKEDEAKGVDKKKVEIKKAEAQAKAQATRARTMFRVAKPPQIKGDQGQKQAEQQFRYYVSELAKQNNAQTDPLQASLGLRLAESDEVLRSQLGLSGAVVAVEVEPKGLAEQAGLKTNDVITQLGGEPVSSVDAATKKILGIGTLALEVKYLRSGKAQRLSLVGPKHGEGFEPKVSYWIGVPVSPVDAILRSQLTELPADAGLIATDVVADSPAAKAEVKKNDILISLAGKTLNSQEKLVEVIQSVGAKPAPLVVVREGKSLTLTITPAPRETQSLSLRVGGGGGAGGDGTKFVFVGPGAINYTTLPNPVNQNVADQLALTLSGVAGNPTPIVTSGTINLQSALDQTKLDKDATSRIEAQLTKLTAELETVIRTKVEQAITEKLEAQLTKLSAELETLIKSVDGMKKPDGK